MRIRHGCSCFSAGQKKRPSPAARLSALREVKFEDFEADAMGMTEDIYKSLSIPGFAEARGDIEKYVGGKKGYKKNKYKYDDRTIRLVEENWGFALKQWDYNL